MSRVHNSTHVKPAKTEKTKTSATVDKATATGKTKVPEKTESSIKKPEIDNEATTAAPASTQSSCWLELRPIDGKWKGFLNQDALRKFFAPILLANCKLPKDSKSAVGTIFVAFVIV